MNIATNPPPPEQAPKQNSEALQEMAKDYILDGEIEATYKFKSLSVTFRVPSQPQLMQSAEEIDKEVFAEDANVSMDRMQMIRNNNIISLYARKVGNKDFAVEQGHVYVTKKGFLERKKYLIEEPNINVYTMEWLLNKLTEFQASVAEAFKDDNLKNS